MVGIRPGEKLHEVMIPYDEARNTLGYDGYFVVQPQFDWWSAVRSHLNGGERVPENFSYRSNNNAEWLTMDQLRELVEGA